METMFGKIISGTWLKQFISCECSCGSGVSTLAWRGNVAVVQPIEKRCKSLFLLQCMQQKGSFGPQ